MNTTTRTGTKKYQRNIYLWYGIEVFMSMAFMMPVLNRLWNSEMGMTLSDVLTLQALFSLSFIILQIPTGIFADIYGRKKSIVCGHIIIFTGYVCYSFSFNFWAALVSEILIGIGFSFINGAFNALLLETLKVDFPDKEERGPRHKKLLNTFFTIDQTCNAISAIAGSLIAVSYGLRVPLYLEVVVTGISCIIALFLTEPPKDETQVLHWKDIFKACRVLVQGNRQVLGMILYSSSINAATLTFVWLAQPYLESVGIELKNFGYVLAAMNVAGAFLSFFAAKRFEHLIGIRTSMLLFPLFIGTGFVVLGSYPSEFAIPFFFLFYMVRGLSKPIIGDALAESPSDSIRSTFLSLDSMVYRSLFCVITFSTKNACEPYNIGLYGIMVMYGTIFTFAGLFSFWMYYRKTTE